MSFTAAVLGGLASGLVGSMTDALSSPDDASGAMKSVVNGTSEQASVVPPNKTETNPTTLQSALDSAKDQVLTGAAHSGSSAIVRALERKLGTAADSGKAYRSALGAAFPELNPWELSGSSAGGALGGVIGQSGESATQRSEHANQQKALDKQLATQKELGELASNTSITNTKLNNFAAMASLDLTMDKLSAEADSIRAGADLTREKIKSEPFARGQMAAATAESGARTVESGARTKQIGEQTENIQHGDTPVGRGISTLGQVSDAANKALMEKYDALMGVASDVKSFFQEKSVSDRLQEGISSLGIGPRPKDSPSAGRH